jgi:hypothetical protein
MCDCKSYPPLWFIIYYAVGVVLIGWYAVRNWGLWVINPFTWIWILMLSTLWPLYFIHEFIDRKKDKGHGEWF